MASVSVHTTMSLDGFSVGPDDEMGWVFEHAVDVPAALVDDVIATTGAVLGGRRGDEVGRRAERRQISKPFGGRWSGPIFILAHTPPDDESDPAYTFLSGDVRECRGDRARGRRRSQPARARREWRRPVPPRGLVDEILIHLLPVLVGNGVRLFGEPGVWAGLETLEASTSGQVVNVRYRVAR